MTERRRLGGSDLLVSPVGLGCWQLSGGRGLVGSFWPALPQAAAEGIVAAALAGGIDWFDTAEMYGGGRSERALAQALGAAGRRPGEVVVATKWLPLLRRAASLERTIGVRRACLAPYGIDLYQVHNPWSFSSIEEEMAAMARLVAEREIRAVGVSNYTARQMCAAHRALARHGLALASNQMRYSLLDRRIERNGVLAAARELGVTIIAYSPLAQGILTGRHHRDPALIRSRPGPRKWLGAFRRRGLERSRALVGGLEEIAAAQGATAAQVALAWLIGRPGEAVVAIPGATSEAQAQGNAGAMALRLDATARDRLDALSARFG